MKRIFHIALDLQTRGLGASVAEPSKFSSIMFSDPPPDARTPDVHQPLTDTEDTNTAAIVVPIVVVFVIVVITAVVLYWRR